MSLCIDRLTRALAAHGPLVRVVIAGHRGSSPREAGAEMLVWEDGQSGTIGGGALEYQAAAEARAMLTQGTTVRVTDVALGPALGQCCGGAVTLVSERLHPWALNAMEWRGESGIVARPVRPDAGPRPKTGAVTRTHLKDGWLIEPLRAPGAPVWIHGAGHVGRALAAILAPMPNWHVTMVDTAPERLGVLPADVTALTARDPAAVVAWAPDDAHHLVMTYSHELDLALCHAILGRPFAFAGLIGSATKWARFRKRLGALGHPPAAIAGITCPIGDPALGKHPQAIAVGVAAALLRPGEDAHWLSKGVAG